MTNPTIISLCDLSGNWPREYHKNGYNVVQVDPLLETRRPEEGLWHIGMRVQEFKCWLPTFENVIGIMMAPPCTHFCVSGANLWAEKDAKGLTDEALEIVDACLEIKDFYQKEGSLLWWVLENPVGRLSKLRPFTLGYHSMVFHPCDYAGFAPEPDRERYTKRTCLWGEFNTRLPGAYRIPTLGSISNVYRSSVLRSMTPRGFSKAFFLANN